jgi:hypothetical protein
MGYYLRFIIYCCSILLSLYLVWFGLKNYGESQAASPFQTQLIKNLNTLEKPTLWYSIKSSSGNEKFIWFRAKFLKNTWFVEDNKNTPLETVLENSRNPTKLIFIDVREAQALPHLREILKKNNAWENIIICSRADGIIKDLRDLEPDWTYCNGEVFLTRFLALSSIGLGSLTGIRSDLFFIHLEELKLNKNLLKIISEAKRQHKLIFTGPVTRPLDSFAIDHWLVN